MGVGRQSAGGEGWKKLKLDSVSDARPASQVATAGYSQLHLVEYTQLS